MIRAIKIITIMMMTTTMMVIATKIAIKNCNTQVSKKYLRKNQQLPFFSIWFWKHHHTMKRVDLGL